MSEIPNTLVAYLEARHAERMEAIDNMLANMPKTAAPWVREAAVAGFFLGANAAGGLPPGAEYPKDSAVVRGVMDLARAYRDLYPKIARLDK